MGVIAKGIPRGCQGLFTPVSLEYPLSVFNKNSTLNGFSVEVILNSTKWLSRLSSVQRRMEERRAQHAGDTHKSS